MRLRWRAFERTAWRRARAELRASETLWRDYKTVRKARWRRRGIRPWVARLIFLVFVLPLVVQGGLPGRGSVDFVVAFLWLWAAGSCFLRAAQLTQALYYSPGLVVLSHLPLSDEDAFRIQWKSFLKVTCWSAVDFFVGYAALAFCAGAGFGSLPLGLALGGVQWGFIVAIATSLFAYGPRRVFHLMMLLCVGCAAGLIFFGPSQPALVGGIAKLGYWTPPAGWMRCAMRINASGGALQMLVPGMLAAVVLGVFPLACRKIRREYKISEDVLQEAHRATATCEAASPQWPELVDQFAQSPADAEKGILSRAFLAPFDWRSAGIVDRILVRALTVRERTIVEFLVAAQPKWTAGLRGFLIVALTLLVLGRLFAAQLQSNLGLFLVVGLCFLYAFSVVAWRGLQPVSATGLQPPHYPFYPIGFGELMRSLLKINVGRYLLCVLILLVLMPIFTGSLVLTVALTLGLVGKVFLLGLFAQPLIAIAPVSSASNDSNRLGFALLAVLFILAMVAAGAGFVLMTDLVPMALCGALTAALPVAGLLIYGRRFNHGRFDLIPTTKQDDF